jgi:hypothetical protein
VLLFFFPLNKQQNDFRLTLNNTNISFKKV